jgi:hypothetical protein
MESSIRYICLGLLMGAVACLPAMASDCPSLREPGKVNADTRNCLESLKVQFAEYTPDIEFLSERNALLSANPYANQKLVIDTFFISYCGLVSDPRWELTAEDRAATLQLAQEKLYTRVPFPVPVADSRNFSHNLPEYRTYWVSSTENLGVRPQFAMLGDTPAAGAPMEPAAEPLPESAYIQDVPFYVTKANRNFVIVAAAGSSEDAFDTVRRLKAKAPQFDFVAYAPYQGNPNYGVMMATWVSWPVAQQALADARKYVAADAFIWSCRELGDSC